MRLASFNLENLFLRARALNVDTWAEGRDSNIIGKGAYVQKWKL